MTLAQIMELALRQLSEDPADIADYDIKFKVYANEGYHLAARLYLRAKERRTIRVDEKGIASVSGMGMGRIIEVTDEHGSPVPFLLSTDGEEMRTMRHDEQLTVLCDTYPPPLEEVTDEPVLPLFAHAALADYICYRHLSDGNMAKQSRAQFYLSAFHQTMRGIRPQGSGSITGMRNLYAATDIRRS